MRAFQYKHGDRPLDGYTIQRAAGRGGFGEVYYAVSDSGREVALKVIQGYEQVELRGVSQCMNLKSPYLVTIFDVKYNAENVPFVIMEFVSGPSLRQILDEAPSGLGVQKAAYFLREIAKGLSYLHDCGIVHRDLKPANIFYENGYAKIGDYGLSKAITESQHSGQTVTVGTLHYMAPEIGVGKYDRGIDIYALGALLFEMLTGQVPYIGSSPAEILMKHLSAEPDVSGIEEPFATVIKRAMAKDPLQRYQSVQEMVEAVFGSEHVQQSMSCFSPDSLSAVAQRVAQRVAVGGGSATPPPLPRERADANAAGVGAWVDRAGDRISALGDRVVDVGMRYFPGIANRARPSDADDEDSVYDPMSRRQRRILALIVLVIIGVAVAVLDPLSHEFGVNGDSGIRIMLLTLMSISGGAGGMILARRRVLPQLASETLGMQRLALGGMASAGMLLFTLPIAGPVPDAVKTALGKTLIGVLVPLFFKKWPDCMAPRRPERASFRHAFGAGLFGLIICVMFGGSIPLAIAILAGISLLVQVLSPWVPAGSPAARQPQPFPAFMPTPNRAQPKPVASPDLPAAAAAPTPPQLPMNYVAWPSVPAFVPYIWLAVMVATLSTGIMLFVYAGVSGNLHGEEFAATMAFGIGLPVFGILCLTKFFQTTFRGWWRYLVKPLLLWACVQTILVSAFMLGTANLRDDDKLFAVFFLVFPAILLPVIAFVGIRSPRRQASLPLPSGGPDAPVPAGSVYVPPQPQPQLQPQPQIGSFSQASAVTAAQFVGSAVSAGGSIVLAVFGTVLLNISLAVSLALVANVPEMLAAGIPRPQIAVNLAREIGPEWPQFLHTVGSVVAFVGFFLTAVLLMLARRRAGVAHMLRAVVSLGGLIVALLILGRSFRGEWIAVGGKNGVHVVSSIQRFLNDASVPAAIMAGGIAIAAIMLLVWPAKRRHPLPTSFPSEGAR
jgi:hypothetical protein